MWFDSIVLGTETGIIRFQKNPKNLQSWLVSVISTPIMVTCYTSHILLLVLLPLLNIFHLPSVLLKLLMIYLLLSTFLTPWMTSQKFVFFVTCDRRAAFREQFNAIEEQCKRMLAFHIHYTSGRSLLCVSHFRFAVCQYQSPSRDTGCSRSVSVSENQQSCMMQYSPIMSTMMMSVIQEAVQAFCSGMTIMMSHS